MNKEIKQECREALIDRASFYRLLSSLYFTEVTDELLENLAALRMSEEDLSDDLARGFRELAHYLTRRGPDARTDLAVDYAHVFLAAGAYDGNTACPYESIYTSEEGLVMQEARDEVRAVYLSQGIDIDANVHEPEDHVSFELDFMAFMSDRAVEALDANDAESCCKALAVQLDFALSHLLNWFDPWGKSIEAHAEQGFYPALFKITRAYVREDVELLGQMQSVIEG